jgi:hypothetical protein
MLSTAFNLRYALITWPAILFVVWPLSWHSFRARCGGFCPSRFCA